ncbi:MAG: helix-turn-helix domain-containing protein [Bdellovibrionaceae bacterium]|nr:helix-turn-helix domain-containing protein [Pseudobdellovibrionaceae bacterium]
MQSFNTFPSQNIHERPSKRTDRVIMTDEARVLRELRQERGHSMRSLGAAMSKSDSYVSQVENGRMDPPKDGSLEQYLAAIGGLNSKSFYERVRRYRQDRSRTDRDELLEVAKRATEPQVRQILLLAKTILATQGL